MSVVRPRTKSFDSLSPTGFKADYHCGCELTPENRLAFLCKGTLRFLRIFARGERNRLGLFETIGVAERHVLGYIERSLCCPDRKGTFGRDFARNTLRSAEKRIRRNAF